ncbi:MAG TPA: ABC transporter permease [Terriglobales bacterium]|nr:ABC transporter permease [Terriglobales bacterium]
MISWVKQIASRLRSSFASRRIDHDLEEELAVHLALATEENVKRGMSVEQARRQALIELGGVEQAQQQHREARGLAGFGRLAETVWQDVVYGLRMLRKKPTFTLVAILTLALGVGANTAIFSIVNAVLLRSLPYRDPDRLVRIFFNEPGLGLRDITFSKPEVDDLRNRADVFEGLSPIAGGSVAMSGTKEAERLELAVVGFDYFSMLGATPELGRLYGPQDYDPGFASSVVISDALWHRDFGADPNIIGRTVRLDNDPYVIIGVVPPEFRHPAVTAAGSADVWAAAGFAADPFPKVIRNNRSLNAGLIGQLKPGLTLGEAQARLTALAKQLRRDYPTDYPSQAQWTIEIKPLQGYLVGNVRPMLLALQGAVILIVLIVSLNIANLLLARASGRQQEMALRLALGATRGRMIGQMLTESLLLSVLGGIAGVLAAVGSLHFIVRLVPASIPRVNEITIDAGVLGFALLISIVTGLIFGLAPALQSGKTGISDGIREGGRGSGTSARTGRVRDALVVSELALAVMLMVGAGLLLGTLRDLLRENPGFNPTQVVAANVWVPVPDHPEDDAYRGIPAKVIFDRELLRRIRTIPGVELAAITSDVPTTNHIINDPLGNQALTIEDRRVDSTQDLRAEKIRISPDYFRLMQAPLLRGRSFTEGDKDGKQPVAIIDETTARRYWPDRDPLGRRIRFGQTVTAPWMTIVGIVRDIKSDGLDIDGVPHIYVSAFQDPWRSLSVVVRTSLPAAALDPQIRHEVHSIDPNLPVFGVASMNDVIDRSLASRRFSAQLVGAFAAVALVLASIGIYGLLAYMVGQRSREIGVRMALGAGRSDVLKLFLQRGVVLAGVGIVAGMIFSACCASLIASLLYGVRPHDLGVFGTVPVVLFIVAVLASYLPARRATKVDPIVALREA